MINEDSWCSATKERTDCENPLPRRRLRNPSLHWEIGREMGSESSPDRKP
jgi:hypothetical protein